MEKKIPCPKGYKVLNTEVQDDQSVLVTYEKVVEDKVEKKKDSLDKLHEFMTQ